MERLEKHPHSTDQKCWDCGTSMVHIGTGMHVADEGAYVEHWHWFQCPYCGLYVQTDDAGIGAHRTTDRNDVNVDHRSHDDVFKPTKNSTASWPVTTRCGGCFGWYKAIEARTWHKQGAQLVATSTYARTGQEYQPKPKRSKDYACECPEITTKRGTLENLLSEMEGKYTLTFPKHHPWYNDTNYTLKFINPALGKQFTETIFTPGDVLSTLRPVDKDFERPYLSQLMELAYSPSAQKGHLFPVYPDRVDSWDFAEVSLIEK